MHKIKVIMGDRILNFNQTPKYLGVTLDRTLSFKRHLTKLRGKVASRNNIINKLVATSWGMNAKTLRISALAMVFSTAEYCCPVWINSHHTSLLDTVLNSTMQIISGTVRSTPRAWLPALSNIAPADIRRKKALLREFNKATADSNQPLFNDLKELVPDRLKSRKPPMRTAATLADDHFSVDVAWEEEWGKSALNSPLYTFGSVRSEEFTLPRRVWSNLNRLRTGHGRCGEMLFKWRLVDDPSCKCGHPVQTTEHMMSECIFTKFDGPKHEIAQLTPRACDWLKTLNL